MTDPLWQMPKSMPFRDDTDEEFETRAVDLMRWASTPVLYRTPITPPFPAAPSGDACDCILCMVRTRARMQQVAEVLDAPVVKPSLAVNQPGQWAVQRMLEGCIVGYRLLNGLVPWLWRYDAARGQYQYALTRRKPFEWSDFSADTDNFTEPDGWEVWNEER